MSRIREIIFSWVFKAETRKIEKHIAKNKIHARARRKSSARLEIKFAPLKLGRSFSRVERQSTLTEDSESMN